MCKVVKMKPGMYVWQVAGVEHEAEWEAYDFYLQQWGPAKHLHMACIWPYPYIVNGQEATFEEALQNTVARLPQEAIVYVYEDNESFGALRKKIVPKRPRILRYY